MPRTTATATRAAPSRVSTAPRRARRDGARRIARARARAGGGTDGTRDDDATRDDRDGRARANATTRDARAMRRDDGTRARAMEATARGDARDGGVGTTRRASDARARGTGTRRGQRYAPARGRTVNDATETEGGRGKATTEVDLRVTKSSHGALQRHVNASKREPTHAQKRETRGGGRGDGAASGSGRPPLRAGERIVRAMESIDAPAQGERIAWDVVASAVNPEGGKFKFTTSTLNFAIKELGERGSFDRAHALYLWMSRKQGRYAPNEFTYVSLASAAKTLTQTRTVQNLWQRGIAENDESLICNEIASAVIAALNRVSDWSGAYQVFRDMGDKGKPRNLYTYTAVLTALRDEAKPDEALAVLNEMAREPGVQPTSLAFSLTLTAFDNCRRWIEGNAVAKRIKKYDVRPDATLMHAIITMAGRAGDMAHANEVFDAMRNSTMIVTTYTFNALLGGYARYGDWEGCTEVYDEMKRSKIQPDSYTFTQLISAAERSGEYIAADGVWTEMLRNRIIPHTVMCGAYIHCLGCQGRDLEAEAVMEKMRNYWDVPRNAAVYNALIGAHVRSGEVTRGLSVLDDMQRIDGLMPTEITFAVLIRACQESALHKRAEGLEGMRASLANAGQLIQDLSGASTSTAKA